MGYTHFFVDVTTEKCFYQRKIQSLTPILGCFRCGVCTHNGTYSQSIQNKPSDQRISLTALKIFPRKERLYLNDKYYSKGMHMSQILHQDWKMNSMLVKIRNSEFSIQDLFQLISLQEKLVQLTAEMCNTMEEHTTRGKMISTWNDNPEFINISEDKWISLYHLIFIIFCPFVAPKNAYLLLTHLWNYSQKYLMNYNYSIIISLEKTFEKIRVIMIYSMKCLNQLNLSFIIVEKRNIKLLRILKLESSWLNWVYWLILKIISSFKNSKCNAGGKFQIYFPFVNQKDVTWQIFGKLLCTENHADRASKLHASHFIPIKYNHLHKFWQHNSDLRLLLRNSLVESVGISYLCPSYLLTVSQSLIAIEINTKIIKKFILRVEFVMNPELLAQVQSMVNQNLIKSRLTNNESNQLVKLYVLELFLHLNFCCADLSDISTFGGGQKPLKLNQMKLSYLIWAAIYPAYFTHIGNAHIGTKSARFQLSSTQQAFQYLRTSFLMYKIIKINFCKIETRLRKRDRSKLTKKQRINKENRSRKIDVTRRREMEKRSAFKVLNQCSSSRKLDERLTTTPKCECTQCGKLSREHMRDNKQDTWRLLKNSKTSVISNTFGLLKVSSIGSLQF
ncbi:hypothetical protein VP01_950g2 [Puccinia sorghi]|uniref:Uncharacterized protein n=1 Tax=Puccinia sorghi TaxID=27349 RepID=A0A0L6U6F2_9BASI|nr:hypothetical protein VP01_950g2 [Puccinia sorghi]